MSPDNRETISGISAVVGAELLVVIAIIAGAVVGTKAEAITSAISDYFGG